MTKNTSVHKALLMTCWYAVLDILALDISDEEVGSQPAATAHS